MRFTGLLTGLLALFASAVVEAQVSASQTVTIRFVPVRYAALTPAPVAPDLSGASGLAAGSSYRFVTTEQGQKIIVNLDRPLPAGTTLALRMSAPGTTATAAATVVHTSPVDLVTEIRPTHETTLPMAFIVSATRAPCEMPAQRRLTYTMIAGT